jgi:hypothetical protein
VKHVLVGVDHIFGPWMAAGLGTDWHPGRGHIIGLADSEGQMIAGAWFEGWNEASIMVHMVVDGRLNREFLWFIAWYPFEQLKVRKVIAPIESDNIRSKKWVEKYGFVLEAALKDAAPKGDLLIYTLKSDQCKWLNLKGLKDHGQAQSTSTT